MSIWQRNHAKDLLGLLLVLFPLCAKAQTATPETTLKPLVTGSEISARKLESLEIIGTTRLSPSFLAHEFNLKPGIVLDDALVMATRERLLTLGIFRSAILYQRKGSKEGLVKLIVELEDDESVLGDWALGGQIAITDAQAPDTAQSPAGSPLGYKLDLLGRNFFSSLHRGFLMADVDALGNLRQAHLAYGLPRFTLEDVQFDTEAKAVDVNARYLESMGFGGRWQNVWTQGYKDYDLQYGLAMYVNRSRRFGVPGFPTTSAGPKIGIARSTRFNRFLPGEGYTVSSSLLYSVTKASQSNLELNGAYTFDILRFTFLSLEAKVLTVGVSGYVLRGESRFDFPIAASKSVFGSEPIDLYIRLRHGLDEFEDTRLHGSAGIIGLRYQSSGFIADFSLQIIKSPKELVDDQVKASAPMHDNGGLR